VWERAGAAYHLVGLFRIDTEAERDGHGLIELRWWKRLQRGDCVVNAIGFFAVHLLGGGAITFASFLLHNFVQCERVFGSPAGKWGAHNKAEFVAVKAVFSARERPF
jgi:hypothetical protein